MEIEQFKRKLKIEIIRQFKNTTEAEIYKGLKASEKYINYAFEHEFSIQHVINELTI